MKALAFHQYGLSDVLNLEEIEQPVPKDNEVLVKVKAASINDWDWAMLQGIPFVNRMQSGLRRPTRISILGCDIAGLGKTQHGLKRGMKYMGTCRAHLVVVGVVLPNMCVQVKMP